MAENKPNPATDSPILLIHGAWHGGWCWKYVEEVIHRAAPQRAVFAPSLLGLGDRADALTPELGLQDQVDDVAALVEREGLTNIVLVGHSFGGMVITALAEKIADRIRHLVYFDAVVPNHGEAMTSSGLALSDAEKAEHANGFRDMATDGIAMETLPAEAFGVPVDHPLHDWVAQNLTPHPLKTCTDPIDTPEYKAGSLPRTYIDCTEPELEQPSVVAGRQLAKTAPGWNYVALPTGHDAMVTMPDELAEIILSL